MSCSLTFFVTTEVTQVDKYVLKEVHTRGWYKQNLERKVIVGLVKRQGRPGGVVEYQYTRKKIDKIPQNTPNSSKYTQK